jgi:uncharacterized membrane protein
VVVAGLALWPGWQNQQRDLVGMEHVSAGALGPMVAVTVVLFGVLFLVGRLVGHGVALVDACWPAGCPVCWPTASRRSCWWSRPCC